jgi:hypothetical protein
VRRGSAWPEPKTGGHARGRASKAGARSVFFLAFKGGKIASDEWFTDRELAVAAARDA